MSTTRAKTACWVFGSVVVIATIGFTILFLMGNDKAAPTGTLIILCLTLVALIFYAFYTYEIAEVNKRTYEESKLPVVSLDISPRPNYDTRVQLKNLSDYNVEAFVNLNLKVNGRPIEHTATYSGKEPWFLTAQQLIDGHFCIVDVLKKADTDINAMKSGFSPGNVKKLSMSIEVYYRGVTREYDSLETGAHKSENLKYKDSYTKWLGNPPQKWYFDFSRDVWVYDL